MTTHSDNIKWVEHEEILHDPKNEGKLNQEDLKHFTIQYEHLPYTGFITMCASLQFPAKLEEATQQQITYLIDLIEFISQKIQAKYETKKHRVSIADGGFVFVCHLVGWCAMRIEIDQSSGKSFCSISMDKSYDTILDVVLRHEHFFGSKMFHEIDDVIKAQSAFIRLSTRECGAITISIKMNNTICHARCSVIKGTTKMQISSFSREIHDIIEKYKTSTFDIQQLVTCFHTLFDEKISCQTY